MGGPHRGFEGEGTAGQAMHAAAPATFTSLDELSRLNKLLTGTTAPDYGKEGGQHVGWDFWFDLATHLMCDGLSFTKHDLQQVIGPATSFQSQGVDYLLSTKNYIICQPCNKRLSCPAQLWTHALRGARCSGLGLFNFFALPRGWVAARRRGGVAEAGIGDGWGEAIRLAARVRLEISCCCFCWCSLPIAEDKEGMGLLHQGVPELRLLA